MEYPSNLVVSAGTSAATTPRRQRRRGRYKMHSLAYVRLNQANGGIIRDLSEEGIAIQAVAPLQLGQEVSLRFELLSPRLRMEITGRVAWADRTGQAGVEFLDISPKSRRLLKEWIFTQFLAMAHHVAWESVFVPAGAQDARELSFSRKARPPIRLEPAMQDLRPAGKLKEPAQPPSPSPAAPKLWIPSWLGDGLILISAVLLFSVISLAITHSAPAWPVGLALALAVAGVFAALYAFLFVFWVGMTPGEHLARLAQGSSVGNVGSEEEEQPRFR